MRKKMIVILILSGCLCITAAVIHEIRLYPWAARRQYALTKSEPTPVPPVAYSTPENPLPAVSVPENPPPTISVPENPLPTVSAPENPLPTVSVPDILPGEEIAVSPTGLTAVSAGASPAPIEPVATDSEVAEIPEAAENLFDDYNLGVVTIPVLEISENLLEGTTNDEMYQGIGHLTGSVMPGQRGNCVISAHRTSSSGMEPFRYLDLMQNGDHVFMEHHGKVYCYEMYNSFIVKLDETWVLQPNADEEPQMLTIVTCDPLIYPGGNRPNRLIVRAKLVSVSDITA
jgi:sortase A